MRGQLQVRRSMTAKSTGLSTKSITCKSGDGLTTFCKWERTRRQGHEGMGSGGGCVCMLFVCVELRGSGVEMMGNTGRVGDGIVAVAERGICTYKAHLE